MAKRKFTILDEMSIDTFLQEREAAGTDKALAYKWNIPVGVIARYRKHNGIIGVFARRGRQVGPYEGHRAVGGELWHPKLLMTEEAITNAYNKQRYTDADVPEGR